MSETPFVHPHCHTGHSLLDGACEISQLMDLAAERKMPVIGCKVYISQEGHKTRSRTDRYNHPVLLCDNRVP